MSGSNLQSEVDDLRWQLEEAQETLRAIRTGAVDGLVVEAAGESRVFTLETADRPYRLLVEQMQQGAATLDAGGSVMYCNRRFADMLGRPHERVMGLGFGDFMPSHEGTLFERLLKNGRAGADQSEAHLQQADGSLVPIFLTFNALPEDCGAAIGVLITDLTKQRSHERLKVAMEALKESDRRKNEFLAMLAHELRNPLAPIRNAVQVLRLRGNLGAEVQLASEMMERQVNQMVRLVDDLLDVSRVSRGKIALRLGRIELASAVNHAVEAVHSLVQCMEHELTVTLPSRPIYLKADPTRLAQIVGNLLNNACKFTPKGGRIFLNVEREAAQAVIRVQDSGIGIAGDKLPAIFEMFTQIDTSLERTVSGLGIGLTLVKNLAELHGGTVEARSAGVGHGCEFVVRLPILNEAPEASQGEIDARNATPAKGRRILVVDDNRDSVDSLAMVLSMLGHEVHTAHDGVEAVESASNVRPDVILLDIGLPRMNGYEAARHLRKEPWAQGMVLIALTGWGQEEDRQKSRDSGFDGHMVKPLDFDALRKLLDRLG